MIITNNLSWDGQVTHTTKRIRTVLYQLKLCRHLVPEVLKVKLVTSLIYPHLDYCCAAFTDMTAELNSRLYRAINACVRFIFGVRRDAHITLYYKKLNWLKIDQRRMYFVGGLLYSILHTGQPSLLYSNFNFKTPTDRATRASNETLIVPLCRTEFFKRSFRIASVRLWGPITVFE